MTNESQCRDNCFWYCNDKIYVGRWDYTNCGYYKCCVFAKKPTDWHEGDMLEPDKCYKYISWDDAESLMRKHAKDKTEEMTGYLHYMLLSSSRLIEEIEQQLEDDPDNPSLNITLASFKSSRKEIVKQIRDIR
jgi:hypothetical protein